MDLVHLQRPAYNQATPQSHSMRSKKSKNTLIFILTVLIVGSALYYESTLPEETHVSDDQSSNWKTYQDETHAFEFQYPSETEVTTTSPSGRFGTGVNYTIAEPGSKWMYSIDVEPNTANQTLQEIFDQYTNPWKASTNSVTDYQAKDFYTTDLTVDGKPAKELYIDHFGDVGSTMVTVINNGSIYTISGGVNKGDLDPFLSTFKFTGEFEGLK